MDENAFGILLSYHGIEDAEYRLAPEQFARAFSAFRSITHAWIERAPLPASARVLFLGHALYVEWPDPADRVAESQDAAAPFNPIPALREARQALSEGELSSVAVLTYGSRWVAAFDQPTAEWTQVKGIDCLDFGHPSEPLRRALYADTASQASDAGSGWGPGLYLDTEAVEALGKRPQNQPTLLQVAEATFYRAGS